jgi:protein involved in temperature-dependent protein secretion
MTQLQRNQFNKIYQGTTELIKDLCNEGDYQREFLKQLPCLATVRPQHESCAVTYREEMSSIFKVSANRTTHNQQHYPTDSENDAENVKIICW